MVRLQVLGMRGRGPPHIEYALQVKNNGNGGAAMTVNEPRHGPTPSCAGGTCDVGNRTNRV